MICPVDNIEMNEVKKDNIKYFSCPKCEGVWINKDQLKNIIDKSEKHIKNLKHNYPDVDELDDLKDKGVTQKRPNIQSPGSFFGGLFS